MMQDFWQAQKLSVCHKLVKCYGNLRDQFLAHHSFTSFSFGPRTTYCTSCLGLCKCWEWILDPFVSSSLWRSIRICTLSSLDLLYTVFPSDVLRSYDLSYHFYADDSKYTCPFTVTGEPEYSESKRVSLTPVVGWEPIGSNSITKKNWAFGVERLSLPPSAAKLRLRH